MTMLNSAGPAPATQHTSSLKLAHLNARSLSRRLPEILRMASLNNLDIIAVAETWHDTSSTVNADCYYWEGTPRVTNTVGGGTGLLLSKRLQTRRRTDLEVCGLEATWVEVEGLSFAATRLLVASVYIPPGDRSAVVLLEEVVSGINESVDFVILGDFNAYHVSWGAHSTNSVGRALQDFLLTNRICVVNDPTQPTFFTNSGSPRFPDLSLVSLSLRPAVHSWHVLHHVGSDHFPVSFQLRRLAAQPQRPTRSLLDFRRADWEALTATLTTTLESWSPAQHDSISDAYADWRTIILQAISNHVPTKTVGTRTRFWWSKDLTRL